MFGRKKISYFSIPFLVLVLVIGLRVLFSEKIDAVSLRLFDRYQNLKPRVYKEAPVRFVDIDDDTLAKIGQWPWPRTQVAELISRLTAQGASVVVMDILFAEPDRTSPVNLLPFWKSELPELKALQQKAADLPDHDQFLAKTISENRVVTGFTLTSGKNSGTFSVKAGFAHSGENPADYLPQFTGYISNLASIERNASGSGSFNFIAENDGVLRRVPLIFRYQNQLVPSLAAEALRAAQEASSFIIKTSGASGETNFGEHTGITSVKIGEFAVPTDPEGRIWLYDTGKVPSRCLAAWKVLDGSADSSLIEGNIIFVGSSAAGLKDLRTTPLNPVAAGTEVHAQLAEQILLQDFLNRPDWAPGAEMLFLILLGLALIFFLPMLGAMLCALLSLGAIGTAFAFSWYAFIKLHWLLDPLTPSAAVLIIYLTVSLMNYLRTEAEKNQIRGAFSQYVSPALLKKISDHPELLKLGGEIRPMTVLFSDIRNFTAISEQFSAEELTHFMNRYLTPMTDIILKNSGTVDKYIGDSIMAFWNAPLSDPHHAQNACRAALEMFSYLKLWNAEMSEESRKKNRPFAPIAIGIGINTGECCVGNMGSSQRFDYSVLGDDVNLASRLESQSKQYCVPIVIGQNTAEKIIGFAMLELDMIRVKGKQIPSKIYALLGDSELKENAAFTALSANHYKMITAYRAQRWEETENLLGNLLKEGSFLNLEGLYRLYQERILVYRTTPPGSSWDGVYTALTK